jgi:glycosyltransferase involved in cell wall biosynthesis
MKILHIAPTPFFSNRGCHIRIKNEIDALRSSGVEAVLCTYHHGDDVADVDIRRIRRLASYTQTDAGYSPYKFGADILLFLLALSIAWREKPCLLHGHLHEGGLLAWAVSRMLIWRRMPAVMDMQGSLSGELAAYGTFGGQTRILRLFRALEALVCRLPDFFVCSSRQSRDCLTEQFGIDPRKTLVVGDVVPEHFQQGGAGTSPKIDRHRPADKTVLVYTGSLLPGKGIAHVLEGMRRLLAQRDDLFFMLVGYPIEEAQGFVRRHGLGASCCITGEVPYDQLAGWLGSADLALEPKDQYSGEASGKLVHYMAAGLPVVCFDTPGNRALLGTAGYYATSRSSAAYADAMARALEELPRAKRNAAKAKARSLQRFSPRAAGARLTDLYRRLVAGACKTV